MRVPISYALTYPERAPTPIAPLDLTAGPLEFFEPDTDTFRLLALAREAGEKGGTYPCVFNAANEVAVAATSSSSGCASITSIAWRPIEPVAPSRAIRFTFSAYR